MDKKLHYAKCRDEVIDDIIKKLIILKSNEQLSDFVVLFPNIQERLNHIDEYNHLLIQEYYKEE